MSGADPGATLLIVNARVAGRPQDQADEAVLIGGERITAVGELARLRSLAGPGVREIDAGGRRVVPGLIDSHAHVLRAGLTWERELRWSGVTTLARALELVSERARELGPGEWIPVIGGWHPGQFAEGRGPTRADLDAAASEHPCYVQTLYDEALLNGPGLAAAGFTAADSADPPAGTVERDADGVPTGVVRGQGAFRHCIALMGPAGRDAQALSIRAMLRDLAALGLTGALDPGGIRVLPETYQPLYDVWRAGELSMRLRLFLGAGLPGDAAGTATAPPPSRLTPTASASSPRSARSRPPADGRCTCTRSATTAPARSSTRGRRSTAATRSGACASASPTLRRSASATSSGRARSGSGSRCRTGC
jgi:predicted amidohydrolase YtcJ